MRWECAAPLWAWCCCARGMNCGRRWGKAAPWPREGPREGGRKFVARCRAASRRNDLFVVYRAATGPCAGAGSFDAYAGMRRLQDIAARPRTRVALADARHVGGRGGAAGQVGAISGAGAAVDGMDLDRSVWTGGNWGVCAVQHLHWALADGVGKGRVWRVESFEFADFSRRLLERMATDGYFVGGAGAGDGGGHCAGVLPQARAPRLRARTGTDGILRVDVAAAGAGDGLGDASRRIRRGGQRRNR